MAPDEQPSTAVHPVAPLALVVARDAGRTARIGPISGHVAVDLALVDRLARLRLAAARRGLQIELRDVDPRLADLLELAGVADRFGVRP